MARILGIDLDSRVVRATLVRTSMRKVDVLGYFEVERDDLKGHAGTPHGHAGTPHGHVGTPHGHVGTPHGHVGTPHGDALGAEQAVRTLLQSVGTPPDGVIARIGGEHASVRTVELPLAASKRISSVLPFELEALLPFPAEDAAIDYQPIDQTKSTIRLLAAATPKTRVSDVIDELRNAGAEPRELAVGAAALDGLEILLPELQQPGPFLLVDVGVERTEVCVLHKGRCEMARTLSVGAWPWPEQRSRLAPLLRQSIAGYRAQGAPAPLQVYLSGEAAEHVAASDFLDEVFGLPWVKVALPPPLSGEHDNLARFAVTAALAARAIARGKRLNLRQGEFALKRTMGALRKQSRLLSICGAAVAVALGFSTCARWRVLDEERDVLRAQLASVTKEILGEPIASAKLAKEILDGKKADDDPLPRYDAFDVIHALSSRIPKEIKHDTRLLHVELGSEGVAGRLQLEGTVASIGQRDQVAAALKHEKCLADLEEGRVTPGVDTDRVTYQLEAKILCPEDDPKNNKKKPKGGSSDETP